VHYVHLAAKPLPSVNPFSLCFLLVRPLQDDLGDAGELGEIQAVMASSSQSSDAGLSEETELPASVSQKKAQRSEHPPIKS